eukprot:9477335-Pyramimonas_sp.AAC.1
MHWRSGEPSCTYALNDPPITQCVFYSGAVYPSVEDTFVSPTRSHRACIVSPRVRAGRFGGGRRA